MILDIDKIENLMAAQEVNQTTLSGRFGLTRQRISEILGHIRAGGDVHPPTAGRLAKALGVPVEAIRRDPAAAPVAQSPVRREGARA